MPMTRRHRHSSVAPSAAKVTESPLRRSWWKTFYPRFTLKDTELDLLFQPSGETQPANLYSHHCSVLASVTASHLVYTQRRFSALVYASKILLLDSGDPRHAYNGNSRWPQRVQQSLHFVYKHTLCGLECDYNCSVPPRLHTRIAEDQLTASCPLGSSLVCIA